MLKQIAALCMAGMTTLGAAAAAKPDTVHNSNPICEVSQSVDCTKTVSGTQLADAGTANIEAKIKQQNRTTGICPIDGCDTNYCHQHDGNWYYGTNCDGGQCQNACGGQGRDWENRPAPQDGTGSQYRSGGHHANKSGNGHGYSHHQ